MTSIMLVCAVFASLAVGVLIAYGVCIAMFSAFQMHARQVAGNAARRVGTTAQVAKS
jgi:uncharacterized protein (DUF2062 family)